MASFAPVVYRIFLVEDHPVMREGYARLISREPEFMLCGEAASGTDALQQIPEAEPDLVVVDLSIPGLNGLELIKQLRALNPELKMLVVTAHSEALYADRVLRAGAQGFLNKGAPPAQLLTAIHQVLQGERFLSEAAHERIGQQPPTEDAPLSPLDVLSDRELEVFEYFGRGYSTVQTADALFVSPKTIETHRANIKRKLNLTHANEVVRRATLWVESLGPTS